VCFSLIAGLLLFSIFGGFRKQPDVGISQFGVSATPPVPTSLSVVAVPPVATAPPPRSSSGVGQGLENARTQVAPTQIGKTTPAPGPETALATAPPERVSVPPAPIDPLLANVSPLFRKGLADRTSWEQWFSSQNGDLKAGAEFWAGQRNLPKSGTCHQQSEAFQAGCTAAQERLAAVDVSRRSEPEYKAGWNAFGKPAEPGR
jgi:hypothetical protein